ncbi:MAG: autotransporter-associated beta strand repeat-containing protein [Chthoniobacteraceae bacterium]
MKSSSPNRPTITLRRFLVLSGSIAGLWSAPLQSVAADAFPGSLGFGAAATGGRGGSVYHVTNLNDSGAGSFRDAVSSSNRIIVFDVGGYINLASAVSCKSNLTIAGQTAPGGGIGFTGAEISFASQSNIICRFVRIRPGGSSSSSDDCLSLYRANTVIMDHCSLDFAKWNNIDAVGDSTKAATNFTVQNSIIADPIGQQFGAHTEMVGGYFSWFNNIFANGHNRQPLAKDNTIYINNTLYNFSSGYTTHTSTRFSHDIINNYFICGPASSSGGNAFFQIDTNQSMYYTGNLLDTNKNSTLDGSTITPYPGYQGTGTVLTSPWSSITSAYVSSGSLLTAADSVVYNMSNAGGLPHDDIEALVVSQVKTLGNGTTGYGVGSVGPDGGLYTSQTQTALSNNGFGTIASGTAPIDSDQDGMPDDWESAKGLNAASAADGASTSSSGYTNLEDYLNWLALPHAFVGKNTAAAASSLDIDLTQYAAGFPSGATFTVSSITGGAVTQSGTGGSQVHFVPTVNTGGVLGGFTFAVTSGSYTMTKTFGILISNSAAAKNLLWKGDGTTNAWDTSTANWTNQSTNVADTYATGDHLYFDDTGSHSPSVNITSVLAPGSVTVETDNSNYTLSGYGWLGGTTALVKNGPGTLTIAPTIPTTSGTITSGSASVTVTSSANLTVGMPVSGTGIPSSTTLSAINSSTSITLSKNATQSITTTLSFTPYHTYSGPTTFNAGTILLNAGASLGTGTLNLYSTLTNNAGTGTTVSLANSIVVAAGTSGTVNMGNRMSIGGSASGGGTLNLNINTTVSRDDLTGAFSGFSGTLNLLGSGGVRLFINGGNFDNFGGARVNVGSGVILYPQTNSGGNTITLGELSGAGTLSGGSAGAVVWSVGGSNTSSTFSGTIQNNGSVAAGLTKTGTGTLTLTGTTSHTGTTTVSAGTLAALGPFAGLVTVSGGTLSPGTPVTPVGTLTASNGLTLTSGTVAYDLSNSPSGTNDKITVTTGTLTESSSTTVLVNFSNGYLGSGVYNLVDGAATMASSGNTTPVLSSPQPASTRQTLAISRGSNGSANGFLKLTVTGDVANLTWTGSTSGAWDLVTTASNFSGATDSKFYNLDSVTFDDTSSVGAVTLTGTLQPNVLTVSNNSTAYTLSGSGLIGGATKLVKSGTGTLTLSNTTANTYTGGTTLSAGTLAIGNSASTLGTGLVTISGGTLSLISGASLSNSFLITGNSKITSTGNVTIVSSISNTLSSSGSPTLDLSGISGILTVGGDMSGFAGTLSFGSGNGMLRLNGGTNANYGSATALFDLGTGSATICNRNGGITAYLGALQGGSNTTLQGRQTTGTTTDTTYVIGGLNTDNTFNGTIATGVADSQTNLTKVGTGNWTLTGTSSFTGNVDVQGGTLTLAGSLSNNGGDFEIESGSTLSLSSGTITATLVQVDSGATMTGCGTINGDLQIDGTLSSSCGGTIAVSGDLTVNGTMRLTNGTALTVGGTFTNNGVLDILTGSQTLPANFVNNGIVLDSTDVQASTVTISGSNVVVKVIGYSGHNYQLQRSDSLNPASWSNLGTAQAGSGTTLTFTDSGGASGTQRYYRVVVSP